MLENVKPDMNVKQNVLVFFVFCHRQGTVQACTASIHIQEGRKPTLLYSAHCTEEVHCFISESNMMLHIVYVTSYFVQQKHTKHNVAHKIQNSTS